jgi:hypothetical protein
MKTQTLNLKGLFLIFGFLGIFLNANSQDVKLSRQERKEVEKAQMQANFIIMDSLFRAKSFVLEADYLMDRYGSTVPVPSNLNFVRVKSTSGILQTGSNSGYGYNGVGGVTAEGGLGSWKVYKDEKHLNYRLQFTLMTNLGIYDVSMIVSADNNATATITGLSSGKLSWKGHLATVDNSRVFKGFTTY